MHAISGVEPCILMEDEHHRKGVSPLSPGSYYHKASHGNQFILRCYYRCGHIHVLYVYSKNNVILDWTKSFF
jgi:hypothetical protein